MEEKDKRRAAGSEGGNGRRKAKKEEIKQKGRRRRKNQVSILGWEAEFGRMSRNKKISIAESEASRSAST